MTLLRAMILLSDYIIPQITSYILPCTGMTHQKALNTGIIASILLVAAILTTQQQQVGAHMYEVTCCLCGIRERFTEEDEAVVHAYNHERVLTHSTSSGYFVSVNEV